jgi:hypothetical protein
MNSITRAGFVAATLMLPAYSAMAAPSCIYTRDIDSTQTPDDLTILFHMRDKTIYRNALPARCNGLAMDSGGFSYVAAPGLDQICATETTIRLNANGIVCQLGAFTKLPKS